MVMMRRWLPWWQQGPLPPHEVTRKTLKVAGLEQIDEAHHDKATVAGHFGYGAVTGTLYPVVNKLPLPRLLKDVLFGLGVWAASYLGWIPAIGLLGSATKRPRSRNALMIIAHMIWGVATGGLFRYWQTKQAVPSTEGVD